MTSGQYSVTGDTLLVFHNQATKQASLGGLPADGLAHQLLFEIVARQGQGKPDPHSKKRGLNMLACRVFKIPLLIPSSIR